jgi:hypothetical protein
MGKLGPKLDAAIARYDQAAIRAILKDVSLDTFLAHKSSPSPADAAPGGDRMARLHLKALRLLWLDAQQPEPGSRWH